ncbi:hypothetical protein [Pseudomonas sp. NPDC007930]|uniref:hypothetical protein n=1 Tax=Pseudomonas sp. NPDC007930 TaxID=3364417 RepID=UPI0036E1C5A9
MRLFWVLAATLCLTACSATGPDVPSGGFPLQVTHLAVTADAAAGAVDVALVIRNGDGYTLKSALLTLAAYNAQGTQVGATYAVQIPGPLPAKASSPEVLKKGAWRDLSITCVAVIRAQITSLDYASDYADGAEARGIVADKDRGPCGR